MRVHPNARERILDLDRSNPFVGCAEDSAADEPSLTVTNLNLELGKGRRQHYQHKLDYTLFSLPSCLKDRTTS